MTGATLGRLGYLTLVIVALTACSPRLHPPGPATQSPKLTKDAVVMRDGAVLPLRVWTPEGDVKAVLLALHGFNDYSFFFQSAGVYLAKQGVQVYAYDQRGFGKGPDHGFWPGKAAFADDLRDVTALLRQRHPGKSVHILGHSMGGAVVITAMTSARPPAADSIILAAPAVWGRATMPFYQRWTLWLAVHTAPGMTLSGRGLGIKASDNVDMLKALGRDPYFIKQTRVDAIWGLVNLMDWALESSSRLKAKSLILYGDIDQVIKKGPTDDMLARLPKDSHTLTRYQKGYHMLMRDLQAENVWRDIAAWVAN